MQRRRENRVVPRRQRRCCWSGSGSTNFAASMCSAARGRPTRGRRANVTQGSAAGVAGGTCRPMHDSHHAPGLAGGLHKVRTFGDVVVLLAPHDEGRICRLSATKGAMGRDGGHCRASDGAGPQWHRGRFGGGDFRRPRKQEKPIHKLDCSGPGRFRGHTETSKTGDNLS